MSARSSRRTNRRGIASVLAMIFLSLFTILSMSMAVSSTSSVEIAGAQHRGRIAFAASESGLQFIAHQFARVSDLPANENPEVGEDEVPALWTALRNHFEDLNGTANFQGQTVTTNETQIALPQIRVPIESALSYANFQITVTMDAEVQYMTVASVGTFGSAVRRTQITYKWAKDTSVLTYGVASRSGIVIWSASQVEGDLFSTWDYYSQCNGYVLSDDSTVNGTLYTHETQQTWNDQNLDDDIDGETGGISYSQPIFDDRFTADKFDTSKYKIPTTEIRPGVQVGALVDLSGVAPDTTYNNHEYHTREHFNRPVYRNRTFDNIIIPKGYNPIFENCTFNRITYVDVDETVGRATYNWENFNPDTPTAQQEYSNTLPMKSSWKFKGYYRNSDNWPDSNSNNVMFEDCTFNGPVISAVPKDYFWTKNAMHFVGETEFHNNYMPESTILAPNFNINIGGFNSDSGSSKLSGIIVGGIVDIRGDAEVDGTILSMYYPDYDLGTGRYAYRTNIGYYGDSEAGDVPADAQGVSRVTPNAERTLPFGMITNVTIKPQYGSYSE